MKNHIPFNITPDLTPFLPKINQCWNSVQDSPLYKTIAKANWIIDRVEVKAPDEVKSYFMVERNPRPEVQALAEKLLHVKLCCLIGISNDDRTGIEWMPRHVLGRSAIFFLDLDTLEVKHFISGEYVS